MTPIIMLCGSAGSGKDTVGKLIAENSNGVCIAFADPMKQFVKKTFGFSDEQLWEASENRNTPQYQFGKLETWDEIKAKVVEHGFEWLRKLSMDATTDMLLEWLKNMSNQALTDGYLTARTLLQSIGTEFGRNVSKNVWADYCIRVATTLLEGGYSYTKGYGILQDSKANPPDFVVITDGRFRNEIIKTKTVGGLAIKIDSPDPTSHGFTNHVSETELQEIPAHFFDYFLMNDKNHGLDGLRATVLEMMWKIRHNDRICYQTVARAS